MLNPKRTQISIFEPKQFIMSVFINIIASEFVIKDSINKKNE
jgi:hypothetical protein